jgi:hypothetical protein
MLGLWLVENMPCVSKPLLLQDIRLKEKRGLTLFINYME